MVSHPNRSKLNHYVLIDGNSGYVWEEADAPNAIEACKIVDRKLGGEAREYWTDRNLTDGGSCYYVYRAPAGWKRVEDGTRPSEVERVEALPMAALVRYTNQPEFDE